jgi:hypothetical protein
MTTFCCRASDDLLLDSEFAWERPPSPRRFLRDAIARQANSPRQGIDACGVESKIQMNSALDVFGAPFKARFK